MGEADRSHRNERIKKRRTRFQLGTDGNALMNLFAINVIFFLVMMVIQVGVLAGEHDMNYFTNHVVQWVAMPAGLTKLSERPWTFITYMFTDTGSNIIRGITNMIWLWAFGYILQQMAGNNKIIPIYIYGGVAGAIFFIAANYFIAPLAPFRGEAALLGANAAVIAVAMATTSLEPTFRFFTQLRGGIPIWVLMTIYLLVDFAGVASLSAAISLSHFGGAAAGFLFVLFLRRGYDGSMWMNNFSRWVMTLFEPKKIDPKQTKNKVFYNSGDRPPFTKTTDITQKRVDEILDKINKNGYQFLTDEEKNFLKKAAEDDSL